MMLGDRIEAALAAVGLTPAAVGRWLGAKACGGCGERRERLNQLDAWARRVVAGKKDDAAEFLRRIVGVE